jgi:hypothetical protein
MLTVLIIATIATIVALVLGGSLDDLAATRVRMLWLVYAGLALQLIAAIWTPEWLTGGLALAVFVVSSGAIALFLALNFRLPGITLAALGIILNLTVIVANGAMPVSTDAAPGLEKSLDTPGIKHERLDDATIFPWLADVIPVRPLREILSAGDVLLGAGIAYFVFTRTLTGRTQTREAEPS